MEKSGIGGAGALTVSFIQTCVVGVGLSGLYVQLFYGLIIILSLVGHRWISTTVTTVTLELPA